MNIASPS